MADVTEKIAGLTAEKQELLKLLLRQEGVELSRAVILRHAESQTRFPLSFAQERLWFLHQLEPSSPAYNIPTAIRINGHLDEAALERSISTVVQRHESLRTTFTVEDHTPLQIIHPYDGFDIEKLSLTDCAPGERDGEALRCAAEEAVRPFDLVRGPLMRVKLLCLCDEEWVLLVTMHHIVSDGWSVGLFINEITALYSAFSSGGVPSIEELPIQYPDYAVWQRKSLKGETLDRELAYWKKSLGSGVDTLALSTDRLRPAVLSYRGSSHSTHYPLPLVQSLKALGREVDATLFMTLLTGFQALLHRYSHQDDISVGTPIANRTRTSTQRLIGFFVNTLVMRTDCSGNPTFRELLLRVKENALGAYAHQDLPFEKVVEELNPTRDMTRNPFFQVMFALQNASLGRRIDVRGISISQLDISRGTSMFDLTVLAAEAPEGLDVTVEYSTDLFDATTIERLTGHFRRLLESAAADPDMPVSRLAMLPENELDEILVQWNETRREYESEQTLHALFAKQARSFPLRVAVECEGETVTYESLNLHANQLAHFLHDAGVRTEVPVGVCMEKSPLMITALVGILKAGGCYVPFDPALPRERLKDMMEEVRPAVVLCDKQSLDRFPASETSPNTKVVCLDSQWEYLAQYPDAEVPESAFPDSIAYVLYTSGSTGKPKGVCCRHCGVVSLLAHFDHLAPLTENSRCSVWSSQSFDVSVYEIFAPLVKGGTLYIVPDPIRADADRFFAWLAMNRIESAYVPPFMISGFASWCDTQSDVSWLRRLLVGVEPIHEDILARITEKAPQVQIIDGYGPTESTICCTLYPFEKENAKNRNVPIGKAVWNSTIYILDESLQVVPVGVVGELFVGGVGLARGYFHRPDLTADRFIPDPYSNERGGRLYRTGDQVRFLPGGDIEFVGRLDDQVKVRGYRIELGEIEAIVSLHPAVRKCVAAVWSPPSSDQRQECEQRGNKLLVAYVVLAPNQTVNSTELRDFSRSRLPEYMVPSLFVFLDTLPLTRTGKVDRKALPQPELDESQRESRAIKTPNEEILAGIWSDVLHVRDIGATDNFFELGGHSLLASQVVSRIRSVFGCEVALRSMFEHPTLRELAEAIGEAGKQGNAQLLPLKKRGGEEAPLSFAQQRLWFLDQLEPGSIQYNITGAFRVHGPLNHVVLERSINEIIRRHEILRTVFATVDGSATQKVLESLELKLPVEDIRGKSPDECDAESRRIIQEEASRPFDLTTGPLMRGRLVRVGEEESVVVFVMHHIISDGWSIGVLIRELSVLYRAYVHEEESPLEELEIQYADFARWQREWLKGESLAAELDYWKRKLSGNVQLLELPFDRRRPALQSARGAVHEFRLDSGLTEKLKETSRHEGVTLFMTLLGAFQTLLWQYTAEKDISVGSPIANRTHADVEGLIGFFVNTLVLRTDLSGNPTVREVLRRVREVALEAYAHQDVPFEKIVEAVGVERDLSRTPLFQVMFVLQNTPGEALELTDVKLEPMNVDSGISVFDMTVTMAEEGKELTGSLEYNTDLFDQETVRGIIAQFQRLLEQWAGAPERRISELILLPEDEKQEVVARATGPANLYTTEGNIVRVFETAARLHPDAIAVRGAGDSLTYGELNRRANQLANYLVKRGVGSESLVGLMLDRTVVLCVGLLGILKAGGGYVPLDVRLPAERLSLMCEDSGLEIVVTEAAFREYVPALVRSVVELDREREEIEKESCEDPRKEIDGENVAYVIYTSGSTGKPKGVVICHSSLLNHNEAVREAFRLTSDDCILQFSSISFDAAVEEMLPALESGARVILRDDSVLEGAKALEKMILREGITVLDFPTAFWTEWVRELAEQGMTVPPSVRLVAVGGEKTASETLHRWMKVRHRDVRWLNTYGPTETTIISTLYDVGDARQWSQEFEVPIGCAITNTQVYVLDGKLNLVPVGVTGEIVIGGAGIARGYIGKPDLTAERFVPDPYGANPGGRLYRTGDLGRYRRDGTIEYRGRIDHQVKVRGYRIELGEVEEALIQHSDVREAAVKVREEGNVKRLVAFCSVGEQSNLSGETLREYLKGRLPDYMVPSAYVILTTMPHTAAEKIDRQALASMTLTEETRGESYVPPATSSEKTLVEIWSKALGVSRIGVTDNFFELGGDSILSIQVIAKANQAGLRLTAKDLFQYPTVGELARAAGAGPAIHAEQGIVTGKVPLTPIQRWFFDQDFPALNHWNQSLLLEVTAPLQGELVREAVKLLVEHHDALRMRFHRAENEWEQREGDVGEEVPCTLLDLRTVEVGREEECIEATCNEIQQQLDITKGPLLRVAYLDFGEGRTKRLLMVVHHLVMDGVSWRILTEDFQTSYEQLRQGVNVLLPPKTASYKEWAEMLVKYADSAEAGDEMDYWQNLAKTESRRFSVDFAAGENNEESARSVTMSLTSDDTTALVRDVPPVYGTEINDVLLTALAETISDWLGTQVVPLELEGHGREALVEGIDLSRTVGWFTSQFPVALDLRRAGSAGERMKAIKEQLRAIPNKGTGYSILRYLSSDITRRERLQGMPNAELSFNYLGQIDRTGLTSGSFAPAQESGGIPRSNRCRRSHLLDVTAAVVGGQLQVNWTYSCNVHMRSTIETLASEFMRHLKALISHCLSPESGGYTPSDFDLARLDQAQLDKVLQKIKHKTTEH